LLCLLCLFVLYNSSLTQASIRSHPQMFDTSCRYDMQFDAKYAAYKLVEGMAEAAGLVPDLRAAADGDDETADE